MTTFNATTPSPGRNISNGSEDRGGEEGDCGEDEGDAEIVAEEEVVVVVEIVAEEEEIMPEIVEEAAGGGGGDRRRPRKRLW